MDIGNELLYLPYMMAPLIVTVLLGPLLGMFATISICMLGGFFILPEQYVPEKQVQFWILSSLSGMLTVLLTHNLRNRAQLLRAGFFVGLLVMVLCWLSGHSAPGRGVWRKHADQRADQRRTAYYRRCL